MAATGSSWNDKAFGTVNFGGSRPKGRVGAVSQDI